MLCQFEGCRTVLTTTFPYCPVHLEEVWGLAVRPSTIERAGMGLFWVGQKDRDVIKKNDIVTHYSSQSFTPYHVFEKRFCDKSVPYALKLSDRTSGMRRKIVFDAEDLMNFPGRYVNHATNYTEGKKANVRFVDNYKWDAERKRFVSPMRATRPIRKGQELFADYGGSYWA